MIRGESVLTVVALSSPGLRSASPVTQRASVISAGDQRIPNPNPRGVTPVPRWNPLASPRELMIGRKQLTSITLGSVTNVQEKSAMVSVVR